MCVYAYVLPYFQYINRLIKRHGTALYHGLHCYSWMIGSSFLSAPVTLFSKALKLLYTALLMMVFSSMSFPNKPLIISFCDYSFTLYYNTAVPLSFMAPISLQRGSEIFMKLEEDFNHDIFCDFSNGPFVENLSVAESGKIKGQLVFPIS